MFCCVVLVFGSWGDKVFDLLSVCWVRGSGNYDQKKKRYSRLSGGLCCCVSFWFWREIGSFFVVAGKFCYDRKKKSSSRLSGGCAINITTGKIKRYSCLSGRCAIMSVFLVGIVIFVLVQLELNLIQIH